MKTLQFTLILVLFMGFIACSGSKKVVKKEDKTSPYAFNFEKYELLDEVLNKAQASGKIIYIDMSASWCAPCQLMKRDVYTHQETADFFNKNFISYLVDTEKGEGPDLKLIFNVTSYPTLLFVNSKGRVIHRKEGGTYHEGLIQFANEAMALNESM